MRKTIQTHSTVALFILFSIVVQGQSFIGDRGIYILGSADVPIPIAHYNHSFIDGIVIRAKWENIEIAPNQYDFSFIDIEIATAMSLGKKVSIAILGQPAWLSDSTGAVGYSFIDQNPNHPTFGDTLFHPVKYDPIVIQRYKLLMNQLAIHYSNNSSISYFHIFSGVSNDLPQTIADGTPFHQAHFYHPDTLINRLKDLVHHYMSLFPNTPLWNSPDKVKFEPAASGLAQNYVANTFISWGATTYPTRFGVWREDLSGCVIVTTNNPTSHWAVIAQHGCRNGAQMVWNVQDGPNRMNACSIAPQNQSASSKIAVLDSAIHAGLSIDMGYFEIYNADLQDVDLNATLVLLHSEILGHLQQNCSNTTQTSTPSKLYQVKLFPNPVSEQLRVEYNEKLESVLIIDALGRKISYPITINQNWQEINFSDLPTGLYWISLVFENNVVTQKVIKK